MSVDLFRDLVTALDASHRASLDQMTEASEAVSKTWKAALKSEKDTYAPVKDLFKNNFVPPSTALLQRALEGGGPLGEVAAAFLRESPRDAWVPEGPEVPVKALWLVAVHRGARVLGALARVRGAIDVYDLNSLVVEYSVKLPDEPLHTCFAGPDTLRAALRDGRVVEARRGEKKVRVLSELGELRSAYVTEDRIISARVQEDGSGARTCQVLIDDAVIPLDGVIGVGPCFTSGRRAYVAVETADGTCGIATIEGRSVSFAWLPSIPSGGSDPSRPEHAAEFLSLGAEVLAYSWPSRSPTGRRWIRAADQSEDPRFGPDFGGIQVLGDTVWSSRGERVEGGVRTAPIWFPNGCNALVPLSADAVAALQLDAKFKPSLRRYRRVPGAPAA